MAGGFFYQVIAQFFDNEHTTLKTDPRWVTFGGSEEDVLVMRFKKLIAVFYDAGGAVGEVELEVSRITKRNIYVPFYNGAARAYVVPKSEVYTDDYGRDCFDVNDKIKYVDEKRA